MTTSRQILTESQKDLLVRAFNRIIPAEGDFPGAGDLGLADSLEQTIGRTQQSIRMFLEGLAQIDITAVQEQGMEFSRLSGAGQDSTLQSIEQSHPAFFNELRRQCYNGYYTHPLPQELIGYSRPEPSEYRPTPFDESLLEPQKQRDPFWRRV
ncbi:MAG: gluconate 2-dehydrogenase subunit 3 family protein [Dehalococcoidia bacterium]